MRLIQLMVLAVLALDCMAQQEESSWTRWHPACAIGVSFQTHTMVEASVSLARAGNVPPADIFLSYMAFKAGAELNVNGPQLIGPKVSFEYDRRIFSGRLNVIDYTRSGRTDLCLTPEAGLCMAGYLQVLYGYNFHVTSERLEDVVGHRLTISVNLFGALY